MRKLWKCDSRDRPMHIRVESGTHFGAEWSRFFGGGLMPALPRHAGPRD